MRPLTYYVASTIDGFIAGPGGDFGFFLLEGDHMEEISAEYPETIPGHFRGPLGITAENRHFDTVVMGRETYEVGARDGFTSPYPHLRQYVVSRSLGPSPDPAVEVIADDDPAARVRELKEEDGLGIWLCGGGKLAAGLYDEIDEMVVKINPVVIGSGVPLFSGGLSPRRFEVSGSRVFKSGVAMMTYVRS